MRILRYRDSSGAIHYGREHADGSVTRLDGDAYADPHDTGETADVAGLLPPIEPTDILGIGLNYAAHAKEAGLKAPEQPVLFFKLSSCAQAPEAPIYLPRRLRSDRVDYECELAVVIGKPCYNVSRDDALDHVLGYTAANDVSARDWQMQWGGGQWCRGKSFATFAPLGPVLVTADEIPDPNDLRLSTRLNGRTMQDSTTADMIFDVPTLIEFLSGSSVLRPGTVILTGTPQGIGAARKPPVYLKPGDVVEVEVEKVGTLRNPVEEEPLGS